MPRPVLVIGNKAYSSWSLRPWLAMRMAGYDFDEIIIPLDQPDTKTRILEHSPAGKVPVLNCGEAIVWESLAIIEHVAEAVPEAGLWPDNASARCYARAAASEMHAGFQSLRRHYPMNLLKTVPDRVPTPEAEADIARVLAIWRDAREWFPAEGPFLFGAFGAVDAMFAPIVTRFETYGIPVDETARAYMDAMLALEPMREWYEAARAEPWRMERIDAL